MTYDLNQLVANTSAKVYDTVIITMKGNKTPVIEKLPDANSAIAFAKMLVRDWKTMPNTKIEVLDNYNIFLLQGEIRAVLLTREYEVLEGTLKKFEKTLDDWGK